MPIVKKMGNNKYYIVDGSINEIFLPGHGPTSLKLNSETKAIESSVAVIDQSPVYSTDASTQVLDSAPAPQLQNIEPTFNMEDTPVEGIGESIPVATPEPEIDSQKNPADQFAYLNPAQQQPAYEEPIQDVSIALQQGLQPMQDPQVIQEAPQEIAPILQEQPVEVNNNTVEIGPAPIPFPTPQAAPVQVIQDQPQAVTQPQEVVPLEQPKDVTNENKKGTGELVAEAQKTTHNLIDIAAATRQTVNQALGHMEAALKTLEAALPEIINESGREMREAYANLKTNLEYTASAPQQDLSPQTDLTTQPNLGVQDPYTLQRTPSDQSIAA